MFYDIVFQITILKMRIINLLVDFRRVKNKIIIQSNQIKITIQFKVKLQHMIIYLNKNRLKPKK